MVGSLMYLSASRPDIVFAVCMCARYQAKPTEMHLTAIKRIFRYLKGTIHMGLWYPKDSGFDLKALQMLIMQGVMTQGEVLLVQLNFLDIGLLAGHPKSKKVLPSPQQKLNTLPYQDAVLKSSGCVLNSETMDLCLTKFQCIVTIKVLLLSAVIVVNLAFQSTLIFFIFFFFFVTNFIKEQVEMEVVELYFVENPYTNWLNIFTKALPRERLCNTTPTACVKQMSPVTSQRNYRMSLYQGNQGQNSVAGQEGRTVA
ncbi:hypothetical protein Tco_0417480 [Tanacetum coccineum]